MSSDLAVALHRGRTFLKIHTFYHRIFPIALFHVQHRLLEPALPLQLLLINMLLLCFFRKKGKLPRETVSASYELEYGSAEIEMHADSIQPGQKVILVDDLIATGGTIAASAELIERMGGEVTKIIFLMELAGLEGRKKLEKYDVASVITYEGK